ncbi:putative ATP-binding endoribonuclease protein [Rosellinia necatrix]|uniref:Diphthine--ammonia ligase n=1 Tax=Rosellinia necatrix TaxID=77044 RepID=A0A1W2TD55_ROSNE|nr:putative ATP-binding endoribonuclease protein [Rosellinia necatrix]
MAAVATSLSVIALISGGKDSFYSILHCQANGHRVVALANLYPSPANEETTLGTTQRESKSQSQSQSQHQSQPQSQSQSRSQSCPHSLLAASSSPSSPSSPSSSQRVDHNEPSVPRRRPSASLAGTDDTCDGNDDGESDLNSFMYQTVGHQIVPLYARATGLPLHRRPIVGTAVHHGLSYEEPRRRDPQRLVASDGVALRPSDRHLSSATHDLQGYKEQETRDGGEHEPEPEPEPELEDETESLVPLLCTVLKAHPEANALCTGAILSTYQRTRVESIALRLGLVPLSYLWQFTELPPSMPGGCYRQCIDFTERATRKDHDVARRARKGGRNPPRDDARLLRDMAGVGLEARIVKVASAGLDEGFLWENVASEAGVRRMERAMRRFGAAAGRGSILGEGGEFETLVVDGPSSLFKGRIVVSDEHKRVIREGGGCAWLSFRRADVVLKDEPEQAGEFRTATLDLGIPELLDPRFEGIIRCLLAIPAREIEQPGLINPLSCDDNTKPLGNLGSTHTGPIAETGSPTCQLLLSLQALSSQEWCYLGGDGDGAGSINVEEQTVSIVDQIRRRLAECTLPATAITSSIIVLRHMSDFPLVNKHYGSLFQGPNPPSRVTISCGSELLPKAASIAVYLSVQLRLQLHDRRGLHVQSRSYWAPANIGPYSQAIAFPLLPRPMGNAANEENVKDRHESQQNSEILSSPFAISIAGQIPLIPASMDLPPSSRPDCLELQIVLALQHLWRIGVEMQVRWWTSVVAYFPAASSTETIRRQALLAAAAWRTAHLWPHLDDGDEDNDEHDASDDDDDGAGPDLWDRRYNAEFMTYGDEEESFPLSLPNWNVLKGLDTNINNATAPFQNEVTKVPFFFAAEVEELPRQAGVEWHAHLGLTEVPLGSVALHPIICDDVPSLEQSLFSLELHHVVVDAADAMFIQTTAVLRPSLDHSQSWRASVPIDVFRNVSIAVSASLGKLLGLPSQPFMKPKLIYTGASQIADNFHLEETGAVIPCRSLWNYQGHQLCAVSIFETRAIRMKET